MNVMDIVQNSIRANTSLVTVSVEVDEAADLLKIVIEDDGDGMSEEVRNRVSDPFFTTRTTRRIGLGIPYYEMVARMCGGDFDLWSAEGEGTRVAASFRISHIDRAPLGNMGQTFALLAGANPGIDFIYTLASGGDSFVFDTREVKELLEGVGIDSPEIILYMEGYINEYSKKITGGITL